MLMLIKSFFVWWYGEGWLAVLGSLPKRAANVNANFSTATLARTLFQPWRRIISYPGASLNDKFHAALDNLFSRVIGFFVRLFVLLAAALMLLLTTLATFLETLAWPLAPLAVIVFLILAIIQ